MKYMNVVRRYGSKLALGGSALLASASSFAAVDAGVTTALTTAATDAGTVGTAVFTVLVAAMAFKYMRRAL